MDAHAGARGARSPTGRAARRRWCSARATTPTSACSRRCCRPGDEVLSDELNHASLIDGCRLSRATIRVYRHLDVDDLARQLERSTARRRLIVSDSVFSMDGDLAPVAEMVRLAERHGAWLMLDEAHAVGVFGPGGAGLAAELGLGDRVTVRMGTLGKALGSYGAFVAGSRALIELLVNRARAYVYSTALPPAVIAAARAAIAIVARGRDAARGAVAQRAPPARRSRRRGHRDAAVREPDRAAARRRGRGGAARRRAARSSAACSRPAIRPPTVPQGTARLRLTPIATHSEAQIDQATARAGARGARRARDERPRSARRAGATAGAARAATAELDRRFLWHPFTQMRDWLGAEPLVIAARRGQLPDRRARPALPRRRLVAVVQRPRPPPPDHRRRGARAARPRRALDDARPDASRRRRARGAAGRDRAARPDARLLLGRRRDRRRDRAQDRVPGCASCAARRGARASRRWSRPTTATRSGRSSVGYSETFHRFYRPLLFDVLRLTPPHLFRWRDGMSADGACARGARRGAARAARARARARGADRRAAGAGRGRHVDAPAALPRRARRAAREAGRAADLRRGRDRLRAHRHHVRVRAGRRRARPDVRRQGHHRRLPAARRDVRERGAVRRPSSARYEDFVTFFHGHTYTGNPLACAAGLASLDVFRERGHARPRGRARGRARRAARARDRAARARRRRAAARPDGRHRAGRRTARARAPYPAAARIGHRVCDAVRSTASSCGRSAA